MGITENLPPYSFYQNNKLTGIDVDIAHAVFEELNIEIELRASSWARIAQELKSQKLDGIAAFFYSEDSTIQSYLNLTTPIYSTQFKLISNQPSALLIERLEQLDGKTLGLIRGYRYGLNLNDNENINQYFVGKDEQLIHMLVKGRVEFIFAEKLPFMYLSKKLYPNKKFVEHFNLSNQPIVMGMHKNLSYQNQALISKINYALVKLKERKIIESILEKYLTQ